MICKYLEISANNFDLERFKSKVNEIKSFFDE
jgi:hypothetical protein